MVRLLSGVVLAAAFFAIIWFAGATVLLFVALAVAALAFHEFVSIAQSLRIRITRIPALIATLATVIVVPFPRIAVESVIALSLIAIAVSSMRRIGRPDVTSTDPGATFGFQAAVQQAAMSMLAPVYLGLSLGTLVALHVWGGRGAVILLIGTIVVSDSAQYYTGRLFGRHKLAPAISPKKTIEGAIGGLVIGPIFTVYAAYYLLPIATNQLALAITGIAVVVAGIAGDLFESTMKRAAELKDSSALIPGHGGVLDRIDALLFAAPVFFIYLRTLFNT